MDFIQTIRCRLGAHVRARSRILRRADGMLASRCRGCGIPMVRDPDAETWQVKRAD